MRSLTLPRWVCKLNINSFDMNFNFKKITVKLLQRIINQTANLAPNSPCCHNICRAVTLSYWHVWILTIIPRTIMAVIEVPRTSVDYKMMHDAFVSFFDYWLKLKDDCKLFTVLVSYLRGNIKRHIREITSERGQNGQQPKKLQNQFKRIHLRNKMFNLQMTTIDLYKKRPSGFVKVKLGGQLRMRKTGVTNTTTVKWRVFSFNRVNLRSNEQ